MSFVCIGASIVGGTIKRRYRRASKRKNLRVIGTFVRRVRRSRFFLQTIAGFYEYQTQLGNEILVRWNKSDARTSIARRSNTRLDTEEREATSFPSKSSYRRSSNGRNLRFATFRRSIANSRRTRRVKTLFEDRSKSSISGTRMASELSVPVDFLATGKSISRWIQACPEIDKSSSFESPSVAVYLYVERRNITSTRSGRASAKKYLHRNSGKELGKRRYDARKGTRV